MFDFFDDGVSSNFECTFANHWSSDFWFDGLKTNLRIVCFAVVID